jgi:DNA (cytosine-5)-methyltransferase 1
MKSFKFIDLFAGIGGMRLGFESAGGTCVLTCEIDSHATQTYQLNHSFPDKSHKYAKDIFDLKSSDVPKHDVLVAGFPCQPFSIAGLRKGLKDKRGQVFEEIIRILKDKQPPAFLLENVKGMLSHNNGDTYNKIMKSMLEDAGYTVKEMVLNSMTHANIPQNRERLFIVGFLDQGKSAKFTFPEKVKLVATIDDCLRHDLAQPRHFYDDRFDCFSLIKRELKSEDTLYQWRRQYVRENKSNVCPTLTANMGAGGHNVPLIKHGSKIRKLTPRECGLFQGFPNNFKLPEGMAESRLYHQFGNSVTVPLIARIAHQIAKVL